MTDKSTNLAKRNRPIIDRQNCLVDKVILLVGNDMTVMQSIIIQLAQKGADVALICPKVPHETLRNVRESVESVGRRLLVIEESDRNPTSAEGVIRTVIWQMGRLDIFIDLSAFKRKLSTLESEKGQIKEWVPSNWSLMQAALQEIAHA
ncbi:MAG: hypothetical protein IPM39_10650 [Chloroflexi bacterium]|nr:hypothetical protein [Chloroflexota bacterium]